MLRTKVNCKSYVRGKGRVFAILKKFCLITSSMAYFSHTAALQDNDYTGAGDDEALVEDEGIDDESDSSTDEELDDAEEGA